MSETPLALTGISVSRPGILFGDVNQPIQDIYSESADQNYGLGTRLVYNDGREFRYARAGAVNLVKGYMGQASANLSNLVDEIQTVSGADQDAGDREITVDITTGSSLVDNSLVDGMMLVNKSTGVGDIYMIDANKIRSSDILLDLQLRTVLRNNLAGTTEVTLVYNRLANTVVIPTTALGVPAGITLDNVTATFYYWAQTKGYAPCYVDTGETLVLGEPVGYPATPNVAGACGPVGADTDATWGIAQTIATAGEPAIIDLQLN